MAKKARKEDSNRITFTDAKKLGLTDGECRKLPHIVENRTGRYGSYCVKLIDRCAVDRLVRTPKVIERLAKRPERSQRALATAQQKREQLLEAINDLQIRIPKIDKKTLQDKAYQSYRDHKAELMGERGHFDSSNASGNDAEFLDRICVNYLRHASEVYEDQLEEMFGRSGKEEGYNLLKERVLGAIADEYPDLAGECQRQEYTMMEIEEYKYL